MPKIFNYIQSQQGQLINDPIVNFLPAIDLSIPIFISMYGLGILFTIRVFQTPILFYKFLKVYLLVTCSRFLLMYFLPLEPPVNMVNLVDPFTKIFYGGKVITKDLFFSGHTSTMFIIYLILCRPTDKILAICVTIFIGFAVLFQHVHYSFDVLAAFPITWLINKLCNIELKKGDSK